MGARGRQAGEEVMVADLSIAVPRPPMAITLPAGTWCNLSSPRPIIRYNPSTCSSRHQQPEQHRYPLFVDVGRMSPSEMNISHGMTCHVMGCQSIVIVVFLVS